MFDYCVLLLHLMILLVILYKYCEHFFRGTITCHIDTMKLFFVRSRSIVTGHHLTGS